MDEYRVIKIHGYHGGYDTVKVDPEDYAFLSQWSWKRSGLSGYARRTVQKKTGRGCTTQYMHHLLVGDIKAGLVVDHINGDKLDNRKKNLRVCTKSENQINRRAASGRCGFLGVTEHYGKFQARIRRNKKRIYLGRFDTAEEAAAVIREYNLRHGYVVTAMVKSVV